MLTYENKRKTSTCKSAMVAFLILKIFAVRIEKAIDKDILNWLKN